MLIHNFDKDIVKSFQVSEYAFWNDAYKTFFGDYFKESIDHKELGEHQKVGIDRTVVLTTADHIYIDEKYRLTKYNDILCEEWSREEEGVKGWIEKPLRCHYIAYAILPLGRVYLLPTIQLQQAWRKNKDKWKEEYGSKKVRNTSYTTVFTPVPVSVIYLSIMQCMVADIPKVDSLYTYHVNRSGYSWQYERTSIIDGSASFQKLSDKSRINVEKGNTQLHDWLVRN